MGAGEFNGDVSDWNVSSVKDMESMFSFTTEFNCNVSDWDVSSVKYMDGMFYEATEFNSDVSDWNVSSVKSMNYMFSNAIKFDNSQICKWNLDDKDTYEWLTGSLCSSTSCMTCD